MKQSHTTQHSIFDFYPEHEPGKELKFISDWLDKNPDLIDWVQCDLTNKLIIIIFICLTTSVFADDFKCQHYELEQADKWLCSHLERGLANDLLSNSVISEKALIDDESLKKIQILISQAEWFYEEGNYPQAEQNYRQIIKKYKLYAPAWIKLAQLYSDLNREQDALQTLSLALEFMPDNADILYETGLVQVRLRHFSNAVNSLAWAAIKAPENAHYSYVYAIALNSTRRPYKAIDVLQQTLQRHPGNMEILMTLFSICQDMNNHRMALVFAQKILVIEPDNDSIQRYVIEFKKY